jgi:hypothetical protein
MSSKDSLSSFSKHKRGDAFIAYDEKLDKTRQEL